MAKTILFLAANPLGTERLRLDKEANEIEEGLRRSKHGGDFVLREKWATSPDDLRRAMLDFEPEIVHFSGHGAGSNGIVLEDNSGQPSLVSAEALQGLFELFPNIECVVLNACYSQVQAEVIAKNVKYVVGMQNQISDSVARKFSVSFYDAIGAGKSIVFAHQLGCNAIKMYGIPANLLPLLISDEEVNNDFNRLRVHNSQTPLTIKTVSSDSPERSFEISPKFLEERRGCYVDVRRGILAISFSLFLALIPLFVILYHNLPIGISNGFDITPVATLPLIGAVKTPVATPTLAPTPTLVLKPAETATPIQVSFCNDFNQVSEWDSQKKSYAGWEAFAVDNGAVYRSDNVDFSLEQAIAIDGQSVKISSSQPYNAGFGSPIISVPPGADIKISVKYMITGYDTGEGRHWASLGVKPDANSTNTTYVNGYEHGKWAELAHQIRAGDSGQIMILLQGQSVEAQNSNIYFDNVMIMIDGEYLIDCTHA